VPPQYDCQKCPGFCCSYPVIEISKADVARLGRHFGITAAVAETRFTKTAHGHSRVLRRKKDQHFGRICRFFDTRTRRCTIYTARPSVCRSFPNGDRCGYWDFLSFEREHQKDPHAVATTANGQWS
jgi:uncharacterized protein